MTRMYRPELEPLNGGSTLSMGDRRRANHTGSRGRRNASLTSGSVPPSPASFTKQQPPLQQQQQHSKGRRVLSQSSVSPSTSPAPVPAWLRLWHDIERTLGLHGVRRIKPKRRNILARYCGELGGGRGGQRGEGCFV